MDERRACDEVFRCRSELDNAPPATEPDAVPVVLALEIAYDVALLRLARVVGVESDPSRFERPQSERARVEGALRDRGISLKPAVGGAEPSSIAR